MEPTVRDLLAGLASVGLLTRYGIEGFYPEEAYEVADRLLEYSHPEDTEGIAKLAKKPRRKSSE